MRDPERIHRIVAALEAFWLKNPDLRFAQVCNYVEFLLGSEPRDFFYIEDDKVLTALQKELSRRH